MKIKKYTWFILLFFLQSISFTTNGQNSSSKLLFNYITIENGLPNNKINSIDMDAHGYLWFGTNDGICRFDGLEVKSYGLTDYSLSENQVRNSLVNKVLIDNTGEIFIGAYTIFYYNKITDKFEIFPFKNGSDYLKRIRTMQIDSKNRIWVGDQTGLYSFSSDQMDSLIAYPFSEEETIDIYSILPLGDSLLIGTNKNSVLVFDIENKKFSPFSLFNNKEDKNMALCFFKENENTIWMGTNNNGFLQFDLKNSITNHVFLDSENDPSNRIRHIIRDQVGNIWIGCRGGLYVQKANSDEISLSANTTHPFSKLRSNSIYDVFIDKHQTIWLGTYSGGVNYADLNRKPFSHYSAKGNGSMFLNDNIISCFCEDINGDIYIGTDRGGVNFFNRSEEEFTYLTHNENEPNSLSKDGINSIVCEKSGNLWIGTNSGGLNYYNPREKTFRHFIHSSDISSSLNNNNVNSLVLDKNQNLWIATNSGIDLLAYGENTFQHLYKGKVNLLYQDKEENLYAAMAGDGLFLFNPELYTFERYFEDYVNSSIRSILIDSENNLWAGGSKGITFVNTTDSTSYTYSKLNGLPSNLIMGILEDEQKNLWISTSSGLLQCENAVKLPGNLSFKTFSLSDGIQSNQFYPYSFMKNSTNEIFFGGINGFNVFSPELIKENNIPPTLDFTGLKIFNQTVQVGQEIEGKIILNKPLSETRQIYLSHKHGVVTFDFVALHYSDPESNKYRYKLSPLEKEWIYTSAERSDATYTSLHGGEYTFMVEASNSDGIWSDSQLSLSVIVSPPFWKTIWFIILVTLFVILLIVSYYLYRIKALKKYSAALENDVSDRTKELQKQKEALQEVNLMKDKLFSIIAHDLRSPFQALLGFSNLLESKFYEIEETKKYSYAKYISRSAKSIYELLTNLLTWSRAQTSNISFEQEVLDLHEIIDQNLELRKNSLQNKNIEVTNKVGNSIKVFADKNMTETILRNIISNAIKFTPIEGKIIIDAKQLDSMMQVSIKDTGIGITEEDANNLFSIDKTVSRTGTLGETGTGLGLLICKEFVLKQDGKIWVESEPDKGSTFYFTLKNSEDIIPE